ncbi:MAG TPA: glycosyltransferase family 2 protein [Candidatus Limnocylindria bacterium]|nr:glycosyltransferase family 2 protein [Candidatus Limnocylindria bacterium]
MNQQLISIIVPVYNEAANLPLLYKELTKHTNLLPYRFELIFVDDGSSDDSPRVLARLAKAHKNVRLIQLARNFGKEAAMAAGLHASRGDAVTLMDADLQMPPSILGQFLEKWRDGAEVVVGVFASRKMSRLRSFGAHCFYRIMQTIGHTKITPHATDYRLLDRKVVDKYNHLTERNRITRGLIDWLGFQRDYVYFDQAERLNGTPTYSFRKLIALAMNSFTAYSLVPLKMAGYLGILILTITIPASIFMFAERFLLGDPLHLYPTGTAFLAMMIIFLVGVVLACLGLMSLYIAHIHAEVINRPLYVVRTENADEVQLIPRSQQDTSEPLSEPERLGKLGEAVEGIE